ncbi:MAG: hypothetical protein NZ891_07440 [bacterium]|nr:hypothetical protein [bacterium]MDW8164553.1 hypothetical protein [Candidatus Omnitrophota bacterium]
MKQLSIYNEIVGVLHIHFPIKNWPEYIKIIVEEGKRAKLDFLILTSHTPKKKKEKFKNLFVNEGYYGNILVIHGEEVDKNKKDHFIVIGKNNWTDEKEIEEILNKESFIKLVTHPYGKHRLFFVKKDYKWNKWNKKFDGIEVWSLLFEWAKKTKIYNIPIRYLKFPLNVNGPDERILEKWDSLNSKRKIWGFAGLDIHSLPFFFRVFDFKKSFSYKKIFKTLRNHIYLRENLTKNFEIDKIKILNSIKNGNFFFANDYLRESSGFYFGELEGKYFCGEEGKIGDIILIKNPIKAKTRLIRNGKIVLEKEIEEEIYKVEREGNYRVEVYINNKNWIFSNNIYIKRR